jgi:hypothetical protein
VLAFLIGASAVWGQQPQSVPLTLAELLNQARQKNPSLLAAGQNILSVQAQEIQAGVRQNPNFSVVGTAVTPRGVRSTQSVRLQRATLTAV